MNHWLELSIEYANNKCYLDDLFRVYPTIPEGIREIDGNYWEEIQKAFENKDNRALFEILLKLELFPIKDSYVAYFKRDKTAIKRNPATVDRLCGRLYDMGLEEIFEKASEPKETNRKIWPLFKRWINSKVLGITPIQMRAFVASTENAILDATDNEMMNFASRELNYKHDKGLDFLARFNNKYIIGEAKFLTDFGGHQNAQFADAITTLTQKDVKAEKIAILDGVLYIPGDNKMYRALTTDLKDYNIMSSLVLREFLYNV